MMKLQATTDNAHLRHHERARIIRNRPAENSIRGSEIMQQRAVTGA